MLRLSLYVRWEAGEMVAGVNSVRRTTVSSLGTKMVRDKDAPNGGSVQVLARCTAGYSTHSAVAVQPVYASNSKRRVHKGYRYIIQPGGRPRSTITMSYGLLVGKTVVITGAATGIGRATAIGGFADADGEGTH
jgi:hypothetical protein